MDDQRYHRNPRLPSRTHVGLQGKGVACQGDEVIPGCKGDRVWLRKMKKSVLSVFLGYEQSGYYLHL
jgi:hypothetical protein